jgi:hypothetical protein
MQLILTKTFFFTTKIQQTFSIFSQIMNKKKEEIKFEIKIKCYNFIGTESLKLKKLKN